MASPIQIVLNPENFEEAREAGGGGGAKISSLIATVSLVHIRQPS